MRAETRHPVRQLVQTEPCGSMRNDISKASKTRLLVYPEARTCETLCKPMGEQNPRLTSGLSPVYQQDEKRSLFLAADQWNDAYLSL